jgi:hypothetical protein
VRIEGGVEDVEEEGVEMSSPREVESWRAQVMEAAAV